jgi:AraC family transcriptional regulator
MNNPNNGESGTARSGIGNVGTGNTPPIWHEFEAVSVILRSFMHAPGEAVEHNHASAELILNMGTTSGAIVWRDADGVEQTAELHAEDCCLIPAGVSHLVSGLRVRGVVSLLVGGVLLAEMARRNVTAVVIENLRQLTAHDTMAGELMADLGRVILRQPQALWVNTLGFALALKLLHSLMYRENGYVGGMPPFSPSEKTRVLGYLREHLAERMTVSELARKLGLSRAHFTRRFHATFGTPPLRYWIRMRVDQALELLRSGEYRVSEAALAVGFCDQSHLDRHCRNFYGRAPSVMLRD